MITGYKIWPMSIKVIFINYRKIYGLIQIFYVKGIDEEGCTEFLLLRYWLLYARYAVTEFLLVNVVWGKMYCVSTEIRLYSDFG